MPTSNIQNSIAMMEKDMNIKNKPNANPFRVPEGYFENLAVNIMEKLPEDAPVVRLGRKPRRTARWIAACAAACLCLVVIGAAIRFDKASFTRDSGDATAQVPAAMSEEIYDEVIAEYTMMDNYDIYAYISDSSAE